MSLQKSFNKHKVEGKGYYHKRKKIEYKDDFKKFCDSNAGMKHFNNFCESNNRADLKVEIEEVDASQKEELN
jgi:tRNA U38,U39,U40 pseudouridine synthase TruA